MHTISPQAAGDRRRRRLHSDEFKANAVASAAQPGVSMASVAMSLGINANLLRRWVRDAEVPPVKSAEGNAPRFLRSPELKSSPSSFVPVQLPAPVTPPSRQPPVRALILAATAALYIAFIFGVSGLLKASADALRRPYGLGTVDVRIGQISQEPTSARSSTRRPAGRV
ncbi:transposase [Variovorax sp. J22R24]|uniref:transposase n=1 Tax=Variovorax gracilis TaxID=3053502 RepID=UPI0025777EA3|nr:transposase [Variovorax sp. J22R24]MDM0109863.1 transposase [Variovorax sp. J22R24]